MALDSPDLAPADRNKNTVKTVWRYLQYTKSCY
jgi:hypothetical protein